MAAFIPSRVPGNASDISSFRTRCRKNLIYEPVKFTAEGLQIAFLQGNGNEKKENRMFQIDLEALP